MVASVWSGGRFCALTAALIVAFPPVFSGFGKVEGLKLSLSLFLLFLFRGLAELSLEASVTSARGARPPRALARLVSTAHCAR